MEKWIVYASFSAVFAGSTSVIAKLGLDGISSELALFIRTCFVCVFIFGFASLNISWQNFSTVTQGNLFWL